MNTVSLKMSAREMCAPNTINRFLTGIRNDPEIYKLFWPRLVKDRRINCGKQISVKMDDENLEYLRKLKKEIKVKYGIFVPYSMLVCVLVRIAKGHKERVVKSLNVKGYKAMARDFKLRLKGISEEILNSLPDIVMLQEFRVGEDSVFLNTFMKKLWRYYNIVFPKSYIYQEHFNYCLTIMLVGKNVKSGKEMRVLNHDSAGYKLRYNYVKLDDFIYLNCWIPQTFSDRQDNKDVAAKMWMDIFKAAKDNYRKDQKFMLAGDLNSYERGPFEDELMRLNAMLVDCKVNQDVFKSTGEAHILDYVFANKYACQQHKICTTIYTPSIKQLDLSDHEALITVIN